MDVYLDGEPLPGAGRTLATALEAARAQCPARLIVEAVADGAPVPAQDLESPPAQEPYAGELRLMSESVDVLVREALGSAGAALAEARGRHGACAELLRVGDIGGALDALRDVLTAWEGVRSALELCGRAPGDPLSDEASIGVSVNDLAVRLTEVKRCLTAQDWATLADVLLYDLGPLSQRLERALLAVSDRAE
jgi:hypothetical protein